MSASNYAEAKIADHMLGTAAWTMPTGCFIKLHLGDPTDACTGSPALNDVRKAVTFAAATNPGGVAVSSSAATWTAVSTTETYTHFSLWDASTLGNPIAYGALTASVSVTAGDDFNIAAGNLSVTVA